MAETTPRLSGRRAEAARNDRRILESARVVFTADPGAPISAVAEHAGVGISALYRRFPSKEALLQHLAADGLATYIAEVEAALADDGDPWQAFAAFVTRIVDGETQTLVQRLAGTFTPTEELYGEAARAQQLNVELFERTAAAGVLRPGLTVEDVSLLIEMVKSVTLGDEERSAELRRRYLALVLDAIHAPAADPPPGSPPGWQEMAARWNPS
jgi:AcrR family transcriptional regulator